MTTTVATTPVVPLTAAHPSGPPAAASRRILAVGIVVGAVALTISLVGLAVDHRVIAGAPAWLKPMKFGVSITAYLIALRWIVGHIPGHRRLLGGASLVIVVALVAEIAAIDMQVVRGTTSHFNESTLFNAIVFYSMGGFISLVFVATLVAGVLLLRVKGLDTAVAAGIRWGLALCVLGMLEAVLMTVNFGWDRGGGHTVGAADGGPGMPLTDWSLAHGDLRIGHFVGLHALQALPILAWLLGRLTRLDAPTRARLIAVAGCGYAGVILLVTWQALRGQALLRPDVLTLTVCAALAVAVLLAVIVVLRRSRVSRIRLNSRHAEARGRSTGVSVN